MNLKSLKKLKTKEQIIQLLKEQKNFLQERFGLATMVLFGSYARNEQTEESDVDLLFEVDPEGTMPLMRLQNLERYLRDFLQIKKIELVRKKYAEPIIYQQIQQQGIAIF